MLIQVKRACSVQYNGARGNNFSFIAGINSTSMLGAEINAVYVTRNRDLFIFNLKDCTELKNSSHYPSRRHINSS